jgi:hypothetical protein
MRYEKEILLSRLFLWQAFITVSVIFASTCLLIEKSAKVDQCRYKNDPN